MKKAHFELGPVVESSNLSSNQMYGQGAYNIQPKSPAGVSKTFKNSFDIGPEGGVFFGSRSKSVVRNFGIE